ncbi:MAG: DUF547 domain-containing protein [Kiloniellaceae bacterium]
MTTRRDETARPSRAPRLAARLLLAAVVFVPLAGLVSIEAMFAPRAKLWERWLAHDPASRVTVDHAPWDRLLKTYVARGGDGVNRFAYRRVTPEDRAALDAYLAGLVATEVSALNRAEQRALWINLYNALTVRVVLDHYPVESIRDIDISPGLFAIGPWDKKLVEIEGEAVSLNDIEHRILRPIWRDPRIHYAVNCASIGCPDLPATAFTAANTEALLEAAARAYVNHARGARLENGKLIVSSIYVWFQEDFGATDAGVLAHLRRYAKAGLRTALERVTGIGGHAYDWRLNDAAPPASG